MLETTRDRAGDVDRNIEHVAAVLHNISCKRRGRIECLDERRVFDRALGELEYLVLRRSVCINTAADRLRKNTVAIGPSTETANFQ